MDIRIWIFLIVLIAYLVGRNNKDIVKAKNNLAVLSCVLLGLQSGLRHICVGPDTSGYYNSFMSNARSSWSDVISGLFVGADEFRDPAYNIIEKVFSTIIPSWQLFLIALAFLYFYALWKLLSKYVETSEGVLLAVMLNLALFNIIALSGMRQQITMSLSMILIPMVEDRRWKSVIPIVLVGSLIHISFLFYLAFIPFQMIKRDNLKFIVVVSLFLVPVIATSARSIVGFMASQIENEYYMGYTNSVQEVKPYTYIALCSMISIFLLSGYKYLREAPQFLTSAVILMTILVPLIMLDGSMIRIGQYFTIYMMSSLPWVIERKFGKWLYLYIIIVLCYLSFSVPNRYYFFWESVTGYIFEPFGIS